MTYPSSSEWMVALCNIQKWNETLKHAWIITTCIVYIHNYIIWSEWIGICIHGDINHHPSSNWFPHLKPPKSLQQKTQLPSPKVLCRRGKGQKTLSSHVDLHNGWPVFGWLRRRSGLALGIFNETSEGNVMLHAHKNINNDVYICIHLESS